MRRRDRLIRAVRSRDARPLPAARRRLRTVVLMACQANRRSRISEGPPWKRAHAGPVTETGPPRADMADGEHGAEQCNSHSAHGSPAA